jgi:hypothetical protein
MGRADAHGFAPSSDAQYGYPASKPGKRKAEHPATSSSSQTSGKVVIDLTQDTPPKKRKIKDPTEERRLRRWRTHAPQTYQEIRSRALTQRMFVLDRKRDNSNEEHLVETISLAGTTGNVYTITVDKVPSCNCPHVRICNK